jgi:three-Cys-motif partner protein
MPSGSDKEYWASYTPIQRAKHDLLRRYLGAWFPILARFSGRVIYMDSHAGRGRHAGGEVGSPLVALETLLSHSHRDRILSRCNVVFTFMEQNPDHVESLKEELARIEPLPRNVSADVVGGDYERIVLGVLDALDADSQHMAPSFFFLDPYGFRLPMALMNRILAQPRSELLVTFMFRYIDMALKQESCADLLDGLFGMPGWRRLREIKDVVQRHPETIQLFTSALRAKHCSVMEMRGMNTAIKYSLIHATNHPLGRKRMKEAMWAVSDGTYEVYQGRDPDQMTLLEAEPDLSELRRTVQSVFGSKTVKYVNLEEWVLDTNWRCTHLRRVLRELRKEGSVDVRDYEGRIAYNPERNPTITFR